MPTYLHHDDRYFSPLQRDRGWIPMRSLRPFERAEWGEVYRAHDLTLKREVAIKVCGIPGA
jgi:hypothetical protein